MTAPAHTLKSRETPAIVGDLTFAIRRCCIFRSWDAPPSRWDPELCSEGGGELVERGGHDQARE